MIRISQNDKRWSNIRMGQSGLTLGNYGCLVTAICMGHSKFHMKDQISPAEAARAWRFTDNDYIYGGGLLLWTATEFKGLEFVKRVNGWNDADVRKFSKSEDHFVVMEVPLPSGGRHWLTVIGPSIFGWATNNPWDGTRLWKTVGFGAPYKRKLGYAVFKRK